MATAWVLAELLRIRRHREALLIGAVLPDIYKPIAISLEVLGVVAITPTAILLLEPLHSIAGALLLSLATSTLWRSGIRQVFPLIFLGCMSHLLLDSLLPFGPPLLLPLTPIYLGLQLVWQEDYLPAVVSATAAFAIYVCSRVSGR